MTLSVIVGVTGCDVVPEGVLYTFSTGANVALNPVGEFVLISGRSVNPVPGLVIFILLIVPSSFTTSSAFAPLSGVIIIESSGL